MEEQKQEVFDFWNEASCGELLFMKGETVEEQFKNQLHKRYELEPYITDFAGFKTATGKKVLEIGVGLGADHQMFAENNAILFGIDLTPKAVEFTRRRLELFKLKSVLDTGDAESLPFANDSFDIVYSWGVIHHSPHTARAVSEIHRVLKKGGEARIMIYHKYSFVGYALWIRYGLLKMKPLTSLQKIYRNYLESPGTKAYSLQEAKSMFSQFSDVEINVELSHGDLMSEYAGQRHKGFFLSVARKLWPRALIKSLFSGHGLFMLITAKKG